MSETKRCHRLKSLAVNGGFLDGLEINLAEGLNCLIGHRGTGKTTVLEFVRYALDEFQSGEAGQLCRRRVENLVKRNLGDGRIRLAIETKDGLEYVVDRTASGEPMVLTADGQPTDITINSGEPSEMACRDGLGRLKCHERSVDSPLGQTIRDRGNHGQDNASISAAPVR